MSTSVCVCLSVSLCVSLSTSISLEPHAWSVPIFYACCLWPWLGPPPAGWQNPKGKGQFWRFSSPLTMHCKAFAAKRIQSLITSCSRRDHSVTATFTAKRIIPYQPRRGWWECTLHSEGKVWSTIALLWSPYGLGQTIIFSCCFFFLLSSFFFISSPNLSGQRLDVYHTSTHGVALVRI